MVAQGYVAGGWWPGMEEPFRFSPDPNPYTGHRLTVPSVGGQSVLCDCGAGPYDTATDLERHQQKYRHPGLQ